MGNFYTNFTLKTSDADDVADTMQQAARAGFVSPDQGGYVVVYDAEADEQDVDIIEQVGAMLSKQHQCPVLGALNHDDDILCYWLFDRGRQIDSYNSAPECFSGGAGGDRGGDAELLCRTLGKPAAAEKVRQVLEDDGYVFAVDRHAALCTAIGLPQCAVGVGYQYIERGELPDDMSEDDLRRID